MESEALKPFAYSLTLAAVASVWVRTYAAARRGRKYSSGRRPLGRDDAFRAAGKVIFLTNNVAALASFWTDSAILLLLWRGDVLRAAGLLVLAAATLLHLLAMRHLGHSYSPCFDPHLPRQLVTRGPYRYVRHPIYLANILHGVGYSLASGSVWVLVLSGYGIFKIVKALTEEERYLSEHVAGYREYRSRTSRLIPLIY
ncbi:MAG TPA: isoprenylcysteine carboxylmethyltransferase family protein [Pyrinomonadaceae bacterium]|nr:isoprenylcysteine carboxylmethyltransferase family protein [Pyrinomonadaceae bacterium]